MQDLLSEIGTLRAANETLRRERDEARLEVERLLGVLINEECDAEFERAQAAAARRKRDEARKENRLMRDVVDAACCLYEAWIGSGEYDDAAELAAEAYGAYLVRSHRAELAKKEESDDV